MPKGEASFTTIAIISKNLGWALLSYVAFRGGVLGVQIKFSLRN